MSRAPFAQNDPRTVLDALNGMFQRYDTKAAAQPAGLISLSRGTMFLKHVSSLSCGEYARIQLLKLMLGGSNVLFLDDRPIHLDIPSCEALENALNEYGGTM
jgi:ATP-binding cassette subfamily F protein 3